MTLQLVHSTPTPTQAVSPVTLADDAAAAIVACVAADTGMDAAATAVLSQVVSANLMPWFNLVAEQERRSVARFVQASADRINDGSMIGVAQSEALTIIADRVRPRLLRDVSAIHPGDGPSAA